MTTHGRVGGAGRAAALIFAALAVLVLFAPAASAVTVRDINSAGPLQQIAIGSDLSCQIKRNASSGTGQLFPEDARLADCGTFVAVGGTLYRPDFDAAVHQGAIGSSFGTSLGNVRYSELSQSAVTGAGTSANPFEVTTDVRAGSAITVAERNTYVTGDDFFTGFVTLTNSTGAPVTTQVYRGMDCFLAGSDSGFSFFDTTDGSVGCSKFRLPDTPQSQLEELTPISPAATSHFGGGFSTNWSRIKTRGNLGNVPSAADPFPTTQTDNGASLHWTVTVPANGSTTVVYEHRFSRIVPIVQTPPTVSGSPNVGSTLTTTTGSWVASTGETVRWQRCTTTQPIVCTDIPGATGPNYVVTPDDRGSTLQTVATATSEDNTTAESTSASIPGPLVPLTSNGPQGQTQRVSTAAVAGETLQLLNGAGQPVASLTTAAGAYTVDGTAIVFAPNASFAGDAPAIAYRLTAGARVRNGTYAASVNAVPVQRPDVRSTGTQGQPQSTVIAAAMGATVTLLDGAGNPVSRVEGPDGVYTLDALSRTITFTPVAGFAGDPDPVRYRVNNVGGGVELGSYRPQVTIALDPVTSTGPQGEAQTVDVDVPAGSSIVLIDGQGQPVSTVDVDGVGVYKLDSNNGEITFTPVPGYAGTPAPVVYRLVDGAGVISNGSYRPQVTITLDPVSSRGPQDQPQGVTVAVPAGSTIRLVGADGAPATSRTVDGVGTYALDPASGQITFTPVAGYAGSPPPVEYRVDDGQGLVRTGSYAPQVIVVLDPRTSSAPQGEPQSVSVPVPTGGQITLLDGAGQPVTSVTTPAGVYTLDPQTGEIAFVAADGFAGTAPAVPYRVTDAAGVVSEGTYQAQVTIELEPIRSAGPGTQRATVTVPPGGTVTLVDPNGNPTNTLAGPDGTYVLDPQTGTITFTPADGFTGTPDPAPYRVTASDGVVSDGIYQPVVAAVLPELTSEGEGTQSVDVDVPAGATITLLDENGQPVGSVTVPGQGTYTLDPATQTITFVPGAGYVGNATAVPYRIDDKGALSDGTYRAIVIRGLAPLSSEGPGAQQVDVDVPAGATITLLDGANQPATTVTTAAGTYTLDPATGVIAFQPAPGFLGEAPSVAYRITEGGGIIDVGTYTPVVTGVLEPVSSEGPGRQSVTPTLPPGATITLRDANGDPVDTVTTPQGVYTLDPAGTITFDPAAGFTGRPTPVDYRVTDADGIIRDGSYRPVVTIALDPVRSTGTGAQSVVVAVPANATIDLLDGGGQRVDRVEVAGGVYTLDPASATITFTPAAGFAGDPPPVRYRIDDNTQVSVGPYQPQVTRALDPVRSEGTGTQRTDVDVPSGGSITLLDAAGQPTNRVDTPAGAYVLDPATGVIEFTPAGGFAGTAPAVPYRVTDAGGVVSDGTYQAVVTATREPVGSSGQGTQSVTIDAPQGATITLIGADGAATDRVDGPDGTYTLDPATRTITFTPAPGFVGDAQPVRYRVTDGGVISDGTYRATVLGTVESGRPAAPRPVAPVLTPPAPPAGTPACRSTRRVTINWRTQPGVRLRRQSIRIAGRTRKLRASTRRARIDFSGRSRGTVVVRVTGVTRAGKTVRLRRVFHPCRKRFNDRIKPQTVLR